MEKLPPVVAAQTARTENRRGGREVRSCQAFPVAAFLVCNDLSPAMPGPVATISRVRLYSGAG
jgi:hypothetical protein